jgi:hypothetical protein
MKRALHLRAAAAGLAASAAILAGSAVSEAEDATLVVTRDAIVLPSRCEPHRVAEQIVNLLAALQRGDRLSARAAFVESDPPGPIASAGSTDFRWFSITDASTDGTRFHYVVYDADGAVDHLLSRVADHKEQLVPASIIVTGAGRSTVGATVVFTRSADDLASGVGGPMHLALAKVAIDCSSGRIYTWSMGSSPSVVRSIDAGQNLCPHPPSWTPGTSTIVACTGGPNAAAGVAKLSIHKGHRPTPARCGIEVARRRLLTALSSINHGDADHLLETLATGATFRAGAHTLRVRRDTPEIRAYVKRLFQTGEGWTASLLNTTSVRVTDRAQYIATILRTLRTIPIKPTQLRISIACHSSQIVEWKPVSARSE